MKIAPAKKKFCTFPACSGHCCSWCVRRQLSQEAERFVQAFSDLDADALNDLAGGTAPHGGIADEDDWARMALFVHFGLAESRVDKRWRVSWTITDRGEEVLERIERAE